MAHSRGADLPAPDAVLDANDGEVAMWFEHDDPFDPTWQIDEFIEGMRSARAKAATAFEAIAAVSPLRLIDG